MLDKPQLTIPFFTKARFASFDVFIPLTVLYFRVKDGSSNFFMMLIVAMTFLACSLQVSASNDISGIWKHSAKPVLIEFDVESGLATVKQHDNNDSANGLTVIKDIKLVSGTTNVWSGNMYNGYIDTYVVVKVKLIDEVTIIVIDNKDNEVLRLVRD